MKLLSVTIPCYNSQDYMEHCIETLLTGGEDVEILIVDDGSKDATAEIITRFLRNYGNLWAEVLLLICLSAISYMRSRAQTIKK